MRAGPEILTVDGAEATIHRDAPHWEGLSTAALGSFLCNDAQSGAALLDRAAAILAGEGFAALIGPMDGDTWHRYRVVTESDGSAPYLMEPVSGPADHAAFLAAGFAPISEYVSMRGALSGAIDPAPKSVRGVRVVAWDGNRSEQLFDQLFAASASAFERNRFFKPIEKAAFLKLYEPVIPLIDPRHVLFAQSDGGELVGFLFGIPDRLEGELPKTVILKTYASGLRGVGHLLADTFHRNALALGYSDFIHALMHVDNISRQRSLRYGGTVFRRYALMGRRL
ncbi:hypothetical protein [Dongia deserti]|uniref:hypothetical protein n=1 Tax=Dongia deserti TaxID=2268030 RepID=UPI000E65D394|nr:hypothetical protein [Dongia deserti]